MWEAAIALIENLASAPQLLVVLVMELVRLWRRGKNTMSLRETYKGLTKGELYLIAFQSSLSASPSLIIALSIFFVRF